MKNISKQYQDLLEGKMSRDNFVRNCRQQFPQFISPVTSVDDAIKILKSKRIIGESKPEARDYKDPYVKGYIDNQDGYTLEDCPYEDPTDAELWKDGWMDYETEKQIDHDEETYRRETGDGEYEDTYRESLNEAEDKTEGRWKEATGQGQYERFKDMDNVNFTTFLRAVAFEVSKDPVINDDNLPAIMEKVAKAMKKDPMAYRDLVISNVKDIAKQDETLKMREVKPGNMVDKDNGMKEVKGQEKYKADSAPKTEYKKGKPEGVKEMGVIPKKAPGIKDVMDMPGKEKVLDQLKEALKKSLNEDTHFNYSPGKEVETPKGLGIVRDIMGGTITVEFPNGELVDYQINMLDAIVAKKQRDDQFASMPDLGGAGQKWLSGQINEDDQEVNIQALEKALRTHDWYYRMSDDPRAYDQGDSENIQISRLMKLVPIDIAKELYNKYSPWKMQESVKGDKYNKLKEYLKKVLKKEAIYQKKDQTGATQTVIASSPKSDSTLRSQKFTKISGTDDAKSTQ